MSLWYWLTRWYVRLGVGVYFRTIRTAGLENVPETGPVMFTVNHQNAFLDALLVATSNNRHTHFLARADVFRFALLQSFFNSLNMMPVYRIRDGRDSLHQNHGIFEKCRKILQHNHALMLFPEANHHQRRLLLPLSKGFTRIALGLDRPITIIPVGLNYTHYRRFGASVSINYGKPISTTEYLNGDYQQTRSLLRKVEQQMQQLITSIAEDEHYQEFEKYLDQNPRQYLEPDNCNQWLAGANSQTLPPVRKPTGNSFTDRMIRAISLLLNFPPLLVCRLALKKIGDPVFSSSIKFLTGVMLFPVYYLVLGLAVYSIWGAGAVMAVLALSIFSMWWRKWSFKY